MKLFVLLSLCFTFLKVSAQDSCMLKVHFLYGSRPIKAYKATERHWFGGKMGGHVGIEVDSLRILSFLPGGHNHVFNNKKEPYGIFGEHNEYKFYSMMGNKATDVKKAIVYIPISKKQMLIFDSLSRIYLDEAPYDYAFFGMRCAAAAYEILGQLNITQSYSISKTYRKIFYPKKLRKRLFRMARQKGWRIERQEGSTHRKWDGD